MLFVNTLNGFVIPIKQPVVYTSNRFSENHWIVQTTIDKVVYTLAEFPEKEYCINYLCALAFNISLGRRFCTIPNTTSFTDEESILSINLFPNQAQLLEINNL